MTTYTNGPKTVSIHDLRQAESAANRGNRSQCDFPTLENAPERAGDQVRDGGVSIPAVLPHHRSCSPEVALTYRTEKIKLT